MVFKRIVCLLLLFILIPTAALSELDAVFLNVGQADATLILCDGAAMLIDGGTKDASQYLYSAIKKLNIERIDYVIATHPDSDHIGGLPAALEAAEVGVLYSPTWYSEDTAFLTLKKKATEKNLPLTFPIPGESIMLGGATITFLAPLRQYGANNNLSIVLRIDYGDTSMLFTGDAEFESETDMLSEGVKLSADLLHVGHHGSNTSTSLQFLDAVHPTIGIISVGMGNTYGLPTAETLQALDKIGASIFRTDLHGLIIAHSDGKAISIETEHTATKEEILSSPTQDIVSRMIIPDEDVEVMYIGNVKSRKFHFPTCKGVATMSEKNKVEFHSREEAISLGYEPCGQCQP